MATPLFERSLVAPDLPITAEPPKKPQPSATRNERMIAGDLRTFPIGNVLQFLGASSVTGTLWIWRLNRGAYFAIEEGKIVAVLETGPGVEYRQTTPDLVERAARMAASLMSWPEGQFGFSPLSFADLSSGPRPGVEIERVLMTAVWMLDEARRAG
jgi:hypothetical protein